MKSMLGLRGFWFLVCSVYLCSCVFVFLCICVPVPVFLSFQNSFFITVVKNDSISLFEITYIPLRLSLR